MQNKPLTVKDLRGFGLTLSGGFLAIGILLMELKGKYVSWIYAVSALFLLTATIFPGLLKPLYPLWMGLAQILGWINTRILLCLMFYLVFTPLAIIMRLFGADLLDRKKTHKDTYWLKKENLPFNRQDYEKRF